MRLDSSGNLGLGTSSPIVTLQVGNGSGLKQALISGGGYDLALGASGGPIFGFSSQTISTVFNIASVPLGIGTNASQPLIFGTGAAERMRLDASGNLGIGVTPSAWGTAAGWRVIDVQGGSFFSNGTLNVGMGMNWYNNGTHYIYKTTGPALGYEQAFDGTHRWNTAPSGTAGNAFSFTQAMTLNANGNLALQGGNTSANGVGITFPATQNASSNANTLDDYERGSWTPALAGSSTPGTFPLTASSGKYTKIGNMVTLYCAITVGTPSGSPSGNLEITGLPFGCAAGTSANGAAQIGGVGQSTVQGVSFSTRGASNVLYVTYIDGSNLAQVIQAGSVATSAIIDFCISYPTT